MTLPTIFDCCNPRADVLSPSLSDYAADLRTVLVERREDDYSDPRRFFANSFPTQDLKRLLEASGRRLSGVGNAESSTIRLDSTFGGGKTHGLIALVHLARTPDAVPGEFLDLSLQPTKNVAIAAFDGEMANVAAGVELEQGVRAKTPWGYLAYKLGGLAGFERIRPNDEQCSAPGTEDWISLIGDRPALILLDELAEWLRKLRNRDDWKQLAPFLKGLMAAIDARPDACLVLSLAVGRSGKAIDAFVQENEYVANALQEAESVSARKVLVLNPTHEDETAAVLSRRLFQEVDRAKAAAAIDAFMRVWEAQKAHLPEDAFGTKRRDALLESYPFHPDLIATLNAKTATFQNFQRVRGMLRILAPTIRTLWEQRPTDAAAIHVHHINLGVAEIRTEFTTRLGQQAFDSAISYDIANADPLQPARAQRLDDRYYRGTAPFASYVARSIFVNSMAFNDELRGCTVEQLRAAMLSPAFEGASTEGGASFIEDARKRFAEESGYLDDRTTTVLRFAAEANLTRLIDQTKLNVDRSAVRDSLKREIQALFRSAGSGGTLALDFVAFPGSPSDVPDDANDGRPYLAVIGYEAEAVDGEVLSTPPLVSRIAQYKGSDGTQLRVNRNNVVFLVADRRKIGDMEDAMARRLALEDLSTRTSTLAEHQVTKLRKLKEESVHRAAVAIQQCYRHVLYPSGAALDTAGLAHLALEADNAAANPGAGQKAVMRALHDHGKLSEREDLPLNPTPVRDRTPLAKRGYLTTQELREEFRRDRNQPMLLGDEPLRKLVREGVEKDIFVYVKGDKGEVVYAHGMPPMSIDISENAFVYTKRAAQEAGIWPRQGAETPPPDAPKPPAPQPRVEERELRTWDQKKDGILQAEGPLREAFARLKDVAKQRSASTLSHITLAANAITDAAALVRYAANLRDAKAQVKASLQYETSDGSTCNVEFSGSAPEARHAFDFAAQQIRSARDNAVSLILDLDFDEPLIPDGDAYAKLVDSLGQIAPGPVRLEGNV